MANPALIQVVQATNGTTGTTLSKAMATLTAGSFLVAYAFNATGFSATPIQDTAGNIWTPVPGIGVNGTGFVWTAPNTHGAIANTVQVNFPSTTFVCLMIAEYSGVFSASAFDGIGAFVATATANWTGTSVTTTRANDTVLALGYTDTRAIVTPGGGFTVRANFSASSTTALMDAPATTVGAYQPSFTSGSAGNTTMATVVLASNAPIAATPTYSPVAGSYGSSQSVTITCTTPSSTITYTTDGTTPIPGSHGTVYSGPIPVTTTQTIKAIASATNFTNSAEADAAYTITGVIPVVVDGPMNSALFPVLMARMKIAAAYRNRGK